MPSATGSAPPESPVPAPRATNGTPAACAGPDDRLHLSGVPAARRAPARPVPGEPVALVRAQLLRLVDHGVRESRWALPRSPARATLSIYNHGRRPPAASSSWRRARRGDLSPPRRSRSSRPAARFRGRREELLPRARSASSGCRGRAPGFLAETQAIREDDVAGRRAPPDLQDRRVEITGPTDRKMVINALNSGAQVFMADFEDANSPTWSNLVEGQRNLIDATSGRSRSTRARRVPPERPGRDAARPSARLAPARAARARRRRAGLGQPLRLRPLLLPQRAAGSSTRGSGPYFYLPKLESHLEARLWNDVFVYAQDALGIPRGTIRATVLIETILAAFEMEEILYELREHSAGLNAGRWDYIFSVIKKFRDRDDFVLPDRAAVTMTVPFMRAYTELLVKTCHKRGALAMGGMAAFIPNRRDPEVNENALDEGARGQAREAGDGFDGTWVAHPDLVATATEEFDARARRRPNQIDATAAEVPSPPSSSSPCRTRRARSPRPACA